MKTTVKLIRTLCVVLFFLSVGGSVVCLRSLHKSKAEIERCRNNMEILAGQNRIYKTSGGKWAASVRVLELRNRELTHIRDSLSGIVRNLGIRIERLQSLATASTLTRVDVKTTVRDSVIYVRDTVPVRKAVVFDWRDDWITVKGVLDTDSLDCSITSRDTIYQVVHRIPRKFLFVRWGTKELRQEIVSSNPHTRITYTEFIRLKK